ncbi:MAG: hypothetical protein ACHQDC_05350 [Acidimicrobiales bacterium]
MPFTLERHVRIPDALDHAGSTFEDLRRTRAEWQSIENGLSYARRMAQGRIDILSAEIERRTHARPSDDLIDRLPHALSSNLRSSGRDSQERGRPGGDLEPPAWADSIVASFDEVLPIRGVQDLAALGTEDLRLADERMEAIERELSEARTLLHDRIDQLSAALVDRYRGGAPVDDLLR